MLKYYFINVIYFTEYHYLCSMGQLRDEVTKAHEIKKKKDLEEGPQAAYGYGGKFGVQSDR